MSVSHIVYKIESKTVKTNNKRTRITKVTKKVVKEYKQAYPIPNGINSSFRSVRMEQYNIKLKKRLLKNTPKRINGRLLSTKKRDNIKKFRIKLLLPYDSLETE